MAALVNNRVKHVDDVRETQPLRWETGLKHLHTLYPSSGAPATSPGLVTRVAEILLADPVRPKYEDFPTSCLVSRWFTFLHLTGLSEDINGIQAYQVISSLTKTHT